MTNFLGININEDKIELGGEDVTQVDDIVVTHDARLG